MNILEQARVEIDAIDKELMSLFEKRMEAVSKVALYKKEENLPIFHPEREQMVIEKNVSLIQNPALKPYAKEFLQDMMNVSKEYQKEMLGEK